MSLKEKTRRELIKSKKSQGQNGGASLFQFHGVGVGSADRSRFWACIILTVYH